MSLHVVVASNTSHGSHELPSKLGMDGRVMQKTDIRLLLATNVWPGWGPYRGSRIFRVDTRS